MKTTSATIHLVLRSSKVLSNGTNPIMLRVSWKGQIKEKSTGFSAITKQWDERNEELKRNYPNSIAVNAILRQLKTKAIEARDEFIAKGIRYTAAMIVQALEEPQLDDSPLIENVIARYIADTPMAKHTVENWNTVKRLLIEYKGNVDIACLTEKDVIAFGQWLSNQGKKDGTTHNYISKVTALLRYAEKEGYITENPLKHFKLAKKYKPSKQELYIHANSIDVLFELFFNEVIESLPNGNWRWKDEAFVTLYKGKGKIYSLYLFLLIYYLKGLSPIDCTKLKKIDIKTTMINNEVYFAIDGKRSKTGERYKIRILKGCRTSNVMINGMLMFNEDEYFLPHSHDLTEDNLRSRVNQYYANKGKELREWFDKANEIIVQRNVNGQDIPLIDRNCTFYAARHSYVMAELAKPNCNWQALALAMGKSPRTLWQYMSELTREADLI